MMRSFGRIVLSGVLACCLVFVSTGRAQVDTYQSLLAEAQALSSSVDVAQFLIAASDVSERAVAALVADERKTVLDTVGLAAANRLLQAGAVIQLEATAVGRLSRLAEGILTAAQRVALRDQARQALGDVSTTSFQALQEFIDVRTRFLYADNETERTARRQVVVDWAEGQDTSSLDIESVDWTMMQLLPKWMSANVPQQIDATWTARITPPQSGNYTFSLSPLNLLATRDEGDARHFRLWMSVVVDGQTILEATPEDWVTEGTPVSLTGGQAVPVSVTLRYRLAGYGPLPASGQLYWSGPGMDRQIVAAPVYQLPDSNAHGVRLSVRRTDEFGVHACLATVDRIDQVLGKHAICGHERLLKKTIQRRLDDYLSPEFMAQAIAEATRENIAQRKPHPFTQLPDYRGILNKCSSESRRRIASELALHPELFGPLDVWTMVYFHDAVRFGAEREALDMLGAWMSTRADRVPKLADNPRDYFQLNRAPYRHLTIPLGIEHAASGRWLEENHLVTADGNCNLAVATVVGYLHLTNGRMLEWIGKLDTKLGEATITGDRRVNWLIARAIAEEIRGCPQDHQHYVGCHRFSAGLGWLDEAMLVAQTPVVKERVVQERVARFVALGKLQQAQAALEAYPALANWGTRINELQLESTRKAEREAAGRDALVAAELRRRQKRAADRGDTEQAARYASLLERLEGN